MSLEFCRIIDLPKIHDPRGNLTYIENGYQVPFDVKLNDSSPINPGAVTGQIHPSCLKQSCKETRSAAADFSSQTAPLSPRGI